MSTKIGHFEILSELSKSVTGAVYKANDAQSSQTVALKVINLSAFGEQSAELQKCLLAEAETTKSLSHPNLVPVVGAGEIEGKFCAAMEYIQGNSIATMLSRKEGFSIWDLLDIGRQVCNGLDHAASQNVVHYSLEPAKIMCGWDGGVRILGYGVSGVGKFTQQMPDVPAILHYISPEQLRGENTDARSNIFSMGAIFYEMVTDSKAFNGADAESLRQAILDGALPAPVLVNPKVNPGLSDLIMKALAKDPAERYQSGRELLDDLEKCKESKPQAAKQAPAKGTMVSDAVKAANQAKFIGAAAVTPKPAAPTPAPGPAAPAQPVQAKPAEKKTSVPAGAPAKAAAASAGARSAATNVSKPQATNPFAGSPKTPVSAPAVSMSAATVEPPAEAEAPKIAVDPMMAEDGPARSSSVSFSEMTELPPLKEVYIQPSKPASTVEEPVEQHSIVLPVEEQEKPKSSEAAQKAVKELKNMPPQLIIYSIAGAAVLILIIAVGLVWHINTLNNDGDSPRPVVAEKPQQPVQAPAPAPVQSAPAPVQSAQPAQPVESTPPVAAAPAVPEPQEIEPAAPVVEAQPGRTHVAALARGKNLKKKTGSAPSAIIPPGQMAIDSTPQGAQVQIDGRTDPSWVTPVTLSGLAPGQHSITVSKTGYNPDSRTVDVTSGGKSFVQTHLGQIAATLAVSSTPAGASVYIDGKNTGKVTPAQITVDKGQHVVMLRKSGYIDESTTAQFVLGQTVSFTPAMRELGNIDDIRTVGKMKKLFGNKEAAGMGVVSVKTQPKGAQVAVNEHMLDKDSPVEFAVDPGNYVIDITLTGYAPIHKVISVDKGGKAVIDEVMQRQ
jgi:eukaryotic-like serine/threonine-protein kinase